MTTYNTYQEAKIAMPNACICVFKNEGKDTFFGTPTREGTTLHNGSKFAEPQDYCMTVERFLADGYKFIEGDLYLEAYGKIREVYSTDSYIMDLKAAGDYSRYILRAAALETKEQKRTKVEYIQEGSFKEVLKCAIDGEVFYSKDGNGEFKFDASRLLFINHNGADVDISHLTEHCFYRRIETPIEWWEDAAEFMSELAELSITEDGDLQVLMLEGQIGFGMSRDKWCDFARILLEQGE